MSNASAGISAPSDTTPGRSRSVPLFSPSRRLLLDIPVGGRCSALPRSHTSSSAYQKQLPPPQNYSTPNPSLRKPWGKSSSPAHIPPCASHFCSRSTLHRNPYLLLHYPLTFMRPHFGSFSCSSSPPSSGASVLESMSSINYMEVLFAMRRGFGARARQGSSVPRESCGISGWG